MRLCVSWRIGTSQTHRRSCSCSGDSVIFKTHEQISEIRICSDTQPARPPFLARGFTCARSLQDLSSVLEDCPDAVPAHATTIFQRRARVHSFLGYAWRENRFSRERRPGRRARVWRAPRSFYEALAVRAYKLSQRCVRLGGAREGSECVAARGKCDLSDRFAALP